MREGRRVQSDWSKCGWALVLIVLVLLANVPSCRGSVSPASGQGGLSAISLESAISRRMSVRRFLDTPVPWETLSEVLWAGYGYSFWERTVANLCGNYPILIYVGNETAAYVYQPETQTLRMHKEGDFRGRGDYRAPIQLFIVLNQSRYDDLVWAFAEAGSIGQSIYLAANALGLGTVCVGGIDRSRLHEALSLSEDEVVLSNMPLGYPQTPYDFAPLSPPQSRELPEALEGSMSLREALLQAVSSHSWTGSPLTSQEQSQVLWAAYGFSFLSDLTQLGVHFNITRHRTVPSAYNSYALTLLILNGSGTYSYEPGSHSLEVVREGDQRRGIAAASGQDWVASAPFMLAVVWNSSKDTRVSASFAAYETGALIQNVRLESVSWGLVADAVRVPDEHTMREALGLSRQTGFYPIALIAVGHPSEYRYGAFNLTRILLIATNSTVTGFRFDRQAAEGGLRLEESFNVTGTPGTVGFCNATIPVEVGRPHPSVLIDGLVTDHVLTRNSTHLSLYFVYDHDTTHRVHVAIEYVDPPEQLPQLVLLVLGLSALIVYLRARRPLAPRGPNGLGAPASSP